MRIGVVGLGVVGNAIKTGFERLGHAILCHDIKLNTTIADIIDTEIVFLCVPTPTKGMLPSVVHARKDRAFPSNVLSDIRVHPPIFSGLPCLKRILSQSNHPPSLVYRVFSLLTPGLNTTFFRVINLTQSGVHL